MTLRAPGILLGGLAAGVWGWHAGWPELTALGAAAVVLVVVTVLLTGPAPHVTAELERTSVRVVRGQQATVRMRLTVPRRGRWLRVVEGPVGRPLSTVPLPRRARRGEELSLPLPVDTSRRGVRPIGPFSLVHGDPWSLVRRVTVRLEGGTLTVQPRTFAVRRSALPSFVTADSDVASRRSGDQHFFALREYVMGDEPRMVHWRSSARAGKLVVRQQVSAATTGTTVVLDTDTSAYGSDEAFGTGWLDERFEAAVEVAASLVTSQAGATEQVHLATTTRAASIASAAGGQTGGLLDTLAVVRAVAPVDTSPEEVGSVVRRTRCARLIVVTGTPGPRLRGALRAVPGTSTVLVRVGAQQQPALPGVAVVDVARPEDLL